MSEVKISNQLIKCILYVLKLIEYSAIKLINTKKKKIQINLIDSEHSFVLFFQSDIETKTIKKNNIKTFDNEQKDKVNKRKSYLAHLDFH